MYPWKYLANLPILKPKSCFRGHLMPDLSYLSDASVLLCTFDVSICICSSFFCIIIVSSALASLALKTSFSYSSSEMRAMSLLTKDSFLWAAISPRFRSAAHVEHSRSTAVHSEIQCVFKSYIVANCTELWVQP